MKYQYFLASRYRNKDIVLDLANKIRQKGKTVYCFIESEASLKHVGPLDINPIDAMKEFEQIIDWRNDTKVREIFETDMNALKDSEKLILMLPAGKSSHIEAGVAFGLGKPTILIGDQKEAETLYLTFAESYNTPEEFLNTI
jgi:hypothetical protein